MKELSSPVVSLWAETYSPHLDRYEAYELTEQFQRMASLFSPGHTYYYILNMQNLNLDFISPEVERITGIPPEEATILKLVGMAVDDEVEKLVKKEMVIKDFFQRFLKSEDLTSYKLVYTYRMRTAKGIIKHMLHQAIAMTISEKGQVHHVMSIHSDITHLKLQKSDQLSFISLNDNRSYFNLDVTEGVFSPDNINLEEVNLSSVLTARELEILQLLAKGYNTCKISEFLHLSANTVRTHRKNMLQKTRCANTTELVSRSIMEGAIG